MINSLMGSWNLVAWRRISGDGTVGYPLGQDARGLLIYTPNGEISVQLSAGERPRMATEDPLGGSEELRAQAYSGYLAYFGTYRVQGDSVVHDIHASLFPDWTGHAQVRPLSITAGELVLRTPPMQLSGGGTVVNELAWVRAGQASGVPGGAPAQVGADAPG